MNGSSEDHPTTGRNHPMRGDNVTPKKKLNNAFTGASNSESRFATGDSRGSTRPAPP